MSSPTVIVNSTPVVKVSYGLPGIGVPSGGVKPQVLKKSSSADYATEWGDVEVLMLDRTDLTFTGTLSKGDPVYINSSGQIAACDAADAATLPPVGLVAGDVTDPADDVDVILVGALIDANTATFSVGDRLYVAAGGGITATAPSGTDASYSVGVVSKVDSTEGIISVYVDGSNNTFEGLAQNQIWVGNANGVATQYTHQLSTLIDVDPSMSPSSGDFFRYSGTQWEASSSPFTFADITGLDHLPQGHVYVGDSSNLTSTTDTIYVDVANSKVGIGTTSPQEALHVDGRINLSATNNAANKKYILIGTELPNSLFNGAVGIGERVFQNSTTSGFAVAIGREASQNASGNRNVAIGFHAIRGASGSTGAFNVGVGAQTMISLTDGQYNTAVGQSAASSLTSGEWNVSLGAFAGHHSTTTSRSTYVGSQSGYQTSGGNNVAVGYNALFGTLNQSTFENTVAVGYEALTALTTGGGNTAIGYEALHDLTTGNQNTVLGYQAGDNLTTQSASTLIGTATAGAVGSTAVGNAASATGIVSVALGDSTQSNAYGAISIGGGSRSESNSSVAIGNLSRAHETGVFVGAEAGRYNNGEGNTVIGYEAGTGSTQTPGSTYNYNVLLGYRAGHQLETGSGNVFIGYGAGSSTLYDNHRLRISGQSLGVPNSTDLIYGEFDNEFVKINGDLEVRDDIVSSNNEDITIIPDGTGHVLLGNYEFDTNQTLAPALDRYVLTYDGNTEEISLQENPALEGELEINLIVETVKNDTAGTLNKGTVVYITGEDAQGNTTVDVANNTDPTKMPASFVLNEDIAAGATGQAVFSGLLDAVNTSGFAVRDTLYVGTNGDFVNVKPTAPNVIQDIGVVANVSSTDGKVYVSGIVRDPVATDTVPILIRNNEGGPIPAGAPVYATGSVGASGVTRVAIADASDPAKMPAIGICAQDLASQNDDGEALIIGQFSENLNGYTNLSVNDVLYVASSTDSGTQHPLPSQVKPKGASQYIQNIGVVLKTNTTQVQEFKVSCIGRTNDVPNLNLRQIFLGGQDNTTQLSPFRINIDQAPQLGGDLDVNGNKITSASGGDVVIDPDGNGAIVFKSDDIRFESPAGLQSGAVRLMDAPQFGAANEHYIELRAPLLLSGNSSYVFPSAVGSNGQVLSLLNSATGQLAWNTVLTSNNPTLNGITSIEWLGTTTQGELRWYENPNNGSNFVSFKAPASLGVNSTYTLPTDKPAISGYVLSSDTAGNMSWIQNGTGATQNANIGNSNLSLGGNRTLDFSGTGTTYGLKFSSGSTTLFDFRTTGFEVFVSSIGLNGTVNVGPATTTPGEIRLHEGSTNGGTYYTGFKAANMGSNSVYTMPGSYPQSGTGILKSDTSGTLTWEPYVDQVGINGSPNTYEIAFWNGGGAPATQISGDSGLTYNTATNAFGVSGNVTITGGTIDLINSGTSKFSVSGTGDVVTAGDLTVDGDVSITGTSLGVPNTLSLAGKITSGDITADAVVIDEPTGTLSNGDYGPGSKIFKFGSTSGMTLGKLYQFGGNLVATSAGTASASASRMLGVAVNSVSGFGVLTEGVVKVVVEGGSWPGSASIGDPVYMSTNSGVNAGEFTNVAPTATGQIVRVVGYIVDTTNNLIYFNPDSTFIEL